jgi:prepilin-type N-terminal cleavage/methylation domain-containing protein
MFQRFTFNTLHFRTHPTLTVVVVWREYYTFVEILGPTPCLLPPIGMLSDSPHSEFSLRARTSNRGFTLIELLMVIAIIMILAGITFGISRGVQNAQARTAAKAELAVISQALETYKSKFGDYPWVGNPDVSSDTNRKNSSHGLMKTLVGWQSVDGTRDGGTNSLGQVFNHGESVLDVSKLSLSQDWPTSAAEASPSGTTYFTDPWGNAYVYIYKDASSHTLGSSMGPWEKFGYILFSIGADGNASSAGLEETTGVMNSSFRDEDNNIDNIYSGE